MINFFCLNCDFFLGMVSALRKALIEEPLTSTKKNENNKIGTTIDDLKNEGILHTDTVSKYTF